MKQSALASLALSLGAFSSGEIGNKSRVLRFGVIADVHQDSLPNADKRLAAFIDEANREKPDFIIQLGDLTHGKKLEPMMKVWNRFLGPKYHVLGNHDMDYANKETVMKEQGMTGKYYSFDSGDYHFIVLDANYRLKDGKYIDYDHGNYYVAFPNRDLVNPEQIEWLKRELAATDKQCIIFSHQALDECWEGDTIPNRLEIRKIIEEANAGTSPKRKVIACFCGHHHIDDHSMIDGVHYFQINSAAGFTLGKSNYRDSLYAFVTIDGENGRIRIKGRKSEFAPPLNDAGRRRRTGMLTAEIQDRDMVI